MLPQTPDLFQLVSTDRDHREAVADAERQRSHRDVRGGIASLLYALADRVAPTPSLPSVDGKLAGRH
jgi:hypothetical protein